MSNSGISSHSLNTPAILVDLDKLDSNIAQMASLAASADLKLRPHTKIHKSTYVSQLQLAAGACGISVSKLSEAEVYADAGQNDIMVVHPFYGDQKFSALKSLVSRTNISCVFDNIQTAHKISQIGQVANIKIPLLLKIDTGCNRFGIAPGEPALKMAKEVTKMPGVELAGILTHECATDQTSGGGVEKVAYASASAMSMTASKLRNSGIPIKDIIAGSTATAKALCKYSTTFPEITEIHPGAYVFGDRIYINSFSMQEQECAVTVLVTVVGTPTRNRACIDAGYKTLGADPMLFMAARETDFEQWTPTYGIIKGHSDIKLERLSEEIGILALNDTDNQIQIGDKLEILPNHVSLAVNQHERIYGVRDGIIETEIPVECRGMDY